MSSLLNNSRAFGCNSADESISNPITLQLGKVDFHKTSDAPPKLPISSKSKGSDVISNNG